MVINVNINKKDYWNYNKYLIKHMPRFTRSFIINMIIMPLTMLTVMIMLRKPLMYTIAMTISAGLVADIFLIWIIRRQVDKTADKREDILGNHKFELYNKGIKEISDVKNQMHNWKSIRDIKQDENYIYIFLGGLEANIIPKRAFESTESINEFYEKCNEYYQKVKK